MEKLGWEVSEADPALFYKREEEGSFYALVYVDDIEMAGPKGSERIEDLKRELKGIFDIRDLGESTYFLGMEIERKRDERTVKLTQKKLTGEILRRFGMDQARERGVPMGQEVKLTRDGEPLDTEEFPYRELIGSLLYLSVCTRPDIAHSVGVLSRFMSNPTMAHWRAGQGVLKYLAGTRDFGLTYGTEGLELKGIRMRILRGISTQGDLRQVMSLFWRVERFVGQADYNQRWQFPQRRQNIWGLQVQ